MGETFDGIAFSAVQSEEQAMEMVEKLFAAAQPDAVYGEPISAEERTIITASEVSVGMGLAYGFGAGSAGEDEPGEAVDEEQAAVQGSGSGYAGGGGGVSGGRPVAVISIGPDGVEIQPVVDVTKIALALFTTLGAMLFTLGKMRKAARM